MANPLELVANCIVESLELITAEMVAIQTVAMQNRLALDYLLSAQWGTCAFIGAEPCTFIPDNSEEITDLIQKIRTEDTKYHDYNPGDLGLVMWFSSTFGTWGSLFGEHDTSNSWELRLFFLSSSRLSVLLPDVCLLKSYDYVRVHHKIHQPCPFWRWVSVVFTRMWWVS